MYDGPMKRLSIALALALFAAPLAASADDATSAAAVAPDRPAMTPAQRQAMFKTFTSYRAKEVALHKQLRAQLLDALSPAHRTAVGNAIGALAVAASPDPAATAKQIDAVLSAAEQQSIVSASQSFAEQTRALRQQMGAELRNEMPSPPPGAPARPMRATGSHPHGNVTDAGALLLGMLGRSGRPPMSMPGFGMPPGNRSPGGPPPPPDAAPPQP